MALSQVRLSRLVPFIVAAAPLMSQGVSTQISGQISSQQGAPQAGATITARNVETGLTRVVKSDDRGRFIIPILPVGPYQVTVSKEGFQSASNIKVNLNLGDAAPLNIKLAPIASTTVEVTASLSTVDGDRTAAATLVSTDALQEMPVFNRSFTALATLTPQVVVDNQRGNLAIAGQRGVNSSINIDGADNNEPFFGGALGAAEGKTPFTVSIEAIREYQVITDGASAEFGRMGGGYVNAITKNGTNQFEGSLFFYERPKSMVATKPTINGVVDQVADFKQQQFGFSFGGPIVKDKLFFFVAYDAQRRDDPINFQWGGTSNPVTLDPGTYANDAALASRGFNYTPSSDSDTLFLRLDYVVNVDHLLQLRMNYSKFDGNAYTGTSNAYENSISDQIKTMSVVGQWDWTINNKLQNTARINYTTDDMPRTTRASIPQVNISNVGYYGANPYPREYTTERIQFQETLTYADTTHMVKVGVDYNQINISEIFSSFYQGGYSFNDSGSGSTFISALNNFRAGNWNRYSQRFSLVPGLSAWEAGSFDESEDQIAAFAQWDMRVTDTLKVGLGVRWDYQSHPGFAVPDFSNPLATSMPLTATIPSDSAFSPRLSFTWTPEKDKGRTVVRGSVGRYVSTTPSVFLYQVYTVNGVRMAQVDFSASQAATYGIPRGATFDANNPFRFASFPTGATAPRSDIFTFSQDFKNPRTDRFNLGVERSMFDGFVLGLSMAVAHGQNLERVYDMNLGTPTASASGRLIFPGTGTTATRPNANYAKMMAYVSDAESWYHGYTLSVKYQKDGSPFFAQVFYTWSSDKDNDSNERNFSSYSTQNTQQLGEEWGYSERDRRNVITGMTSFHERQWSGILFGLALRYVSATPYSLTFGGDQNRDGVSGNDRVYLNGEDTGRNTQRTHDNFMLDLKISRDFQIYKKVKFQISAEVFNLLNNMPVYLSNRVGGNDLAPTLTPYQAYVGSPRQVQLGGRLSF